MEEIENLGYYDFMSYLGAPFFQLGGPVYHKKDFNIRVHVFLAIIGLLFYRFLAWKTKKYGLSMKGLIDALSGIRIALVKENKSDKSEIVLEEMNSTQGSLFSFLNLGKFILE